MNRPDTARIQMHLVANDLLHASPEISPQAMRLARVARSIELSIQDFMIHYEEYLSDLERSTRQQDLPLGEVRQKHYPQVVK